ncbi:hypothetical protein LUZ60_011004 [Juncus effusus]|nr:hypothetical protein LUZ60_011004 [Juncus effusus]
MMAAESPLSLSPPAPAREDLETLTLEDEEEEEEEAQTSTSSSFAPRLISTARSDLNGSDPLLNPPHSPSPSPPSSPAARSATSPAQSEPQKIQNGGSGSSSARHGPEFTRISVSDPQKEIDPNPSMVSGSSSFVSYLITAKSVTGTAEYRVRRRFRDVVALADRLAESYRGFFVPARPDKSVVEGQVMQKHEFVEQRRAALEKYLRRLAAHPVVGRSEELRSFLRAPGLSKSQSDSEPDSEEGLPVPSRPSQPGPVQPAAKSGRDFFGMFRDIKQTVVGGLVGGTVVSVGPVVIEEDKLFLEKKTKLLDLAQQLTTTSQQAEGLVKAQQDTGETMGEMGMVFVKLAKFETENSRYGQAQPARADLTRLFALTVVKTSRLHRGLNSHLVTHLDVLHEYLGLMIPINNAFSDRTSALNTVQNLTSELSSLNARLEKFEVANAKVFQDKARARKIEELRESIRFTEDAKSNAIRQYEKIKENNKAEMERIERERRHDFLTMLKGFVNSQVEYNEKIAREWDKLAEEMKEYERPRL